MASLHWLLQEPVLYGQRLDYSNLSGPTLSRTLHAAGISTLEQVVKLAGPWLDDPAGLASKLGVRSMRVMNQLLHHWKSKLTRHEHLLLKDFCEGSLLPDSTDPYPATRLLPVLEKKLFWLPAGACHPCKYFSERRLKKNPLWTDGEDT